jgi:hypothetical protein
MPHIPEVGEIWTNTITNVDGIVAYVDSKVDPLNILVTFVSLTGTQTVVQFNRDFVPWTWKFKRERVNWHISPVSPLSFMF